MERSRLAQWGAHIDDGDDEKLLKFTGTPQVTKGVCSSTNYITQNLCTLKISNFSILQNAAW
jgi:hypothetical protein